jgi:hypothetical protein
MAVLMEYRTRLPNDGVDVQSGAHLAGLPTKVDDLPGCKLPVQGRAALERPCSPDWGDGTEPLPLPTSPYGGAGKSNPHRRSVAFCLSGKRC